MNSKIFTFALVAATAAAILWLPALDARHPGNEHGQALSGTEMAAGAPVVDAVFVLDTTGSMSGLIQTAKEKIWSIASTMAAAQPTPAIRIGLVAYRDRGDEYVVRRVDLSGDLDSVYAELMQFEAGGGGDGPESVNAALGAAVDDMSWSEGERAYKVVFLVGDAPPHMDYANEERYPEIVARARQQGITVNAIRCGGVTATIAPWTQIAGLGGGRYLEVAANGSAVAHATPFDEELAALSARLDDTRLYYGSAEDKKAMAAKVAAAESFSDEASTGAKARRGVFNLSDAGRANRLGKNELVDAVASGSVALEEIETEALPAALQPMAPEEQRAYVASLAQERADIESRMRDLARDRDSYLRERVEADGGAGESLDRKLYETVRRQAAAAGLEYDDGPAY